MRMNALRTLVLVLGDQLDHQSSAFDGFDAACDAVWMAEVDGEATHVWSTKSRIAVFLAAMRHFRDELRDRGYTVHYAAVDDSAESGTLADELRGTLKRLQPERLIVVEPGEWRVREDLETTAQDCRIPLEVRRDRHFFDDVDAFREYAAGRKQLRLEYYYRHMRRVHGVLMDGDDPVGGQWNFDVENRGSFGRSGPRDVPPPLAFPPDALTREVLALVERRFASHPGSLCHFDWPVTAHQALDALFDFVEQRLPQFGQFQDAMWTGEPYLYHARIASALNLKLLDPHIAVSAAVQAFDEGHVPIAACEGFVRQILGWREYVRGVYWTYMPEYGERNALGASAPLPSFYWTGKTDMSCLHHTIHQTLEYGYAHHIQRLMVTGLFALLLGVDPEEIHRWYLAVYVDAVEWVELPNTLGMSQYADGGVMASKPYVATGKYIRRMSNYCAGCRYDPTLSSGSDACPFTTLYWDFLARHRESLVDNPRMRLQLRNVERLSASELRTIQRAASELKKVLAEK